MLALAAAPSLSGFKPTAVAQSISPDRYVSVLTFLADPEGREDSTYAFQRAVDYAARNNVSVYVPAGTYRVRALPSG
jgi:polygalacturonase